MDPDAELAAQARAEETGEEHREGYDAAEDGPEMAAWRTLDEFFGKGI